MTGDKITRAREHHAACSVALGYIAAAIARGEPVSLADAKALEAAGCWYRRNMVVTGGGS